MVSPVSSPRKKTQPAPTSSRQASTYLTTEGTASAAAALGLNVASTSVSRATDMLPTPSKTPQKSPSEKTAANIQSFASNLFTSEDEAMPAPRKRRAKRYSAKAVESSTVDENENSIEIFTDSQDRVSVKDQGADNPFYGDAPAGPPRTRKSRRRLVKVPGEGAVTIEEASRREDGMVYVLCVPSRPKPLPRFADRPAAVAESSSASFPRPTTLSQTSKKRLERVSSAGSCEPPSSPGCYFPLARATKPMTTPRQTWRT